MKYTDKERIERIVTTARKLLEYLEVNGISKEDVLNQEPLRWTITTPLYNIGEHVYNLTDEFKEAHADIPWAKISGLRHRLVHDYENTNWALICAVLFDELPGFLREIEAIIL
ncbi:MAG: DUF86 domain-containing protein [Clostridia bacterium]|nr:DUF86 domain-containing protein [Clostridia bacterium]